MATLELRDIHQRYARHTILDGVGFQISSGSIACLLGPSGCGKTTLLRCIAGFEAIERGEIRLNDSMLSRPGQMLPPEARAIGMVFQDYALFPHLDVAANVGFGLRKLPAAERATRVRQMLTTVDLAGSERKYPHELSGGQQQRVALARALAPRPQLLLLDEPFSNLDVNLREHLSLEVRDILKHEGMTAILVTHDQHEAFAMADEIGVMDGGRIQQWDSPYNLYHQPANRFVADFIGQGSLLPGSLMDERCVRTELGEICSTQPLACLQDRSHCAPGCAVEVLLRPDDLILDPHSPLRASVSRKAFRGAEILYTLRLASGTEVLALLPSHHNLAPGDSLGISLDTQHVVVFKATGKNACQQAA